MVQFHSLIVPVLLFSAALLFFLSSARIIMSINQFFFWSLVHTRKELSIQNRKSNSKPIFTNFDRFLYIIFDFIFSKFFKPFKKPFTLVKVETVLEWKRNFIKRFWTFTRKKKRGRTPILMRVKKLIRDMKNHNLKWGNKRISEELALIGEVASPESVRKILKYWRGLDMIKKDIYWRRFLKWQFGFLYGMDFLTETTVTGETYYILFIIQYATRKIVHYAVTKNPNRKFVKRNIAKFAANYGLLNKIYIIHDGAAQFQFNYKKFGIKNVKISAYAPNMNPFAERWVRTFREEVLDNFFIVFGKWHYEFLLKEYVEYYNSLRAHQGINGNTPSFSLPQKEGVIKKRPVLAGLIYNYYRKAA